MVTLLIEGVGSLSFVGYVIAAVWALIWSSEPDRLLRFRLSIAGDAAAGPKFKLAATLLKTPQLQSWNQTRLCVAALELRCAEVGLHLGTWPAELLRAS